MYTVMDLLTCLSIGFTFGLIIAVGLYYHVTKDFTKIMKEMVKDEE